VFAYRACRPPGNYENESRIGVIINIDAAAYNR
jgi:hypothetical protein